MEMNEIAVSVAVITYNMQGYLPQLLDSILEDLYAFAEGVPQFDDITMVVITMKDQAS